MMSGLLAFIGALYSGAMLNGLAVAGLPSALLEVEAVNLVRVNDDMSLTLEHSATKEQQTVVLAGLDWTGRRPKDEVRARLKGHWYYGACRMRREPLVRHPTGHPAAYIECIYTVTRGGHVLAADIGHRLLGRDATIDEAATFSRKHLYRRRMKLFGDEQAEFYRPRTHNRPASRRR